MSEDEIIRCLSLQGDEREVTLKKIAGVVESWGLRLPDVPPDPLHFGFNDFTRVGETEFNVNNNVDEGYCGKFIFQFAGQLCPLHHHRIKHETFFIVKGRVEMDLAGKKIVMKQGDTQVVDRSVVHAFTALEDSLILESSKPDLVDDSIFEDRRINKIIFGVEQPFGDS